MQFQRYCVRTVSLIVLMISCAISQASEASGVVPFSHTLFTEVYLISTLKFSTDPNYLFRKGV